MNQHSDEKKESIVVDEDWKARVEREKAEVADSGEGVAEPSPLETGAGEPELPPPDFSLLVGMFSTQAMVSLGLIPEPGTGKERVQLPLARHFIDLLGVLEEKTRGNLTPLESRDLSERLHALRMMFLELKADPKTRMGSP